MSPTLDDYRRKRDFGATTEPPGSGEAAPGGRRFVIQRHDARALHFDLRLERDGVLASWAVPKGPPLRVGPKRLAVRTEDHPVDYLGFAGVIPAGQYGAGRMTIWDTGSYDTVGWSDDEVKVILHGRIVDGEYHLVRTGGVEGREEWLVFRSSRGSPGSDDPRGRFHAARPMMATPWKEGPFDGDDWAFEIKWDGYRALALVTPDATELRSRTGRDLTASFPSLGDLRRGVDAQEVVLDGEIVVLDPQGRAVFQDLQSGRRPPTFVAFDVLYVDGVWLDELPWRERRQRLDGLITPEAAPAMICPEHVAGAGRALFAAVAARGGEGVVAKRMDAPYRAGVRSPDWRKVKVRHEVEAAIVGYVEGEGSRRGAIGALLVARREPSGELRYIGRVGSGFTDEGGRDLRRRLDRLVSDAAPVGTAPADAAGAVWVRPRIDCLVSYSEWTEEGLMRAPVYLGLAAHEPPERPPPVLDLSGRELRVRDGAREIRLTNLDKVFWDGEGIRKGDVLDHYARLAPALVPHLADRPMVLKRYPNGWDQPFFFQHQIPDGAPDWLRRATLRKGGDEVTYAVVDDPLALLWIVNLGCIDLNPWHARLADVERAGYVLFDFDPAEGVPFDAVIEAALMLRDELTAVGLRGYPKTSGSRGIHVLVPVGPVPHESARLFAQLVGRRMVARRPDLVTVETPIARRGRRVFVDANQNGYGKTIASVYSIRPVPGATVSTPLEWDEVAAGLDPTALTIGAVAERVGRLGDLFAPVLTDRQDLAAAVAQVSAG